MIEPCCRPAGCPAFQRPRLHAYPGILADPRDYYICLPARAILTHMDTQTTVCRYSTRRQQPSRNPGQSPSTTPQPRLNILPLSAIPVRAYMHGEKQSNSPECSDAVLIFQFSLSKLVCRLLVIAFPAVRSPPLNIIKFTHTFESGQSACRQQNETTSLQQSCALASNTRQGDRRTG